MIYALSSYKKAFYLAESFNELSAKQLFAITKIRSSKMDANEAILAALRILLKMPFIKFALLPAEIKERLLPYAEWVFGDNTLTHQLLPKYKGLYGPKSKLLNLRMKEFHACEMRYKMILDGVPGAMDELIAILYRPGKPHYDLGVDKDGDVRIDYNGNTVAARATAIAKWPIEVKQAIVFFYDGCRMELIKNHPIVFDQSNNEQGFQHDQFHGMFMMMRGIAADGKFGDFEKVENLYMYTALTEVTQMLIEQKKLEAQSEITN